MDKDILRDLEIFSEVSDQTIGRIREYGRLCNCAKGEQIFRMREPVTEVCIQIKGKSFLYNLTRDGSRKILFILGEGSLLNDHIAAGGSFAFGCDALENSMILQIPAIVFTDCMKEDFALVQAVMKAQELKIWRLGHQLKNTSGSIYMERKLAAKLWKLQRDFGIRKEEGVEIDADLSMTFLADMMGAPRETVSKTCKLLTSCGLIKISRKRITVTGPAGLSVLYHTGELPPQTGQ